jgi:hypothetical protein|tara:strand:+ start:1333 stop:1683 length:351 start_codon:yes stop_codon:yes gene_type:complete
MHSTTQKPPTVKMIPCIKCRGDMPELRKTQYGYNFCINCSAVGAKRGVPIQRGTGDHTWTETVIMEEDDYIKFTEYEEVNYGKSKTTKEGLAEIDTGDRNLQGPFQIINSTENEDL